MRFDAFVAPGKMVVDLAPLRVGALQRHPGDCAELVARVLEHLRQGGAQLATTLREHQAELGQQPADPVYVTSSLFLVVLRAAGARQHALLLDRS